jgi:hypothetical protein
MIRFHELVFDDYIPGNTPVYTGVQHMRLLGRGDQLGLHAILDEAAVACSITVAIEHSVDGINWSPKNSTAEITAVAVSTTDTTSIYGGETFPGKQSCEFVRLRLTVTNGRGVHVRVYATARDRAKGGFSLCDCADEESPKPRQQVHWAAKPLEEAAAVLSTQPHRALMELRRKLEDAPVDASQQERIASAFMALSAPERAEVGQFLGRMSQISPAARMEILRMGFKG